MHHVLIIQNMMQESDIKLNELILQINSIALKNHVRPDCFDAFWALLSANYENKNKTGYPE